MTKNQLRYIVFNSDWKFLFLVYALTPKGTEHSTIFSTTALIAFIIVSLVSNYFRKEAERDGQR